MRMRKLHGASSHAHLFLHMHTAVCVNLAIFVWSTNEVCACSKFKSLCRCGRNFVSYACVILGWRFKFCKDDANRCTVCTARRTNRTTNAHALCVTGLAITEGDALESRRSRHSSFLRLTWLHRQVVTSSKTLIR